MAAKTQGASQDAKEKGVISTFRDNPIFLMLCVQVAVVHIGQTVIVPILPLYAQSFDVSTAAVGSLLAFQSVPRMFANLPAGRLSDRFGAHRMIPLAAIISALAALAGGFAPSYGVLLLTQIVAGVGTAISQTSGLTYTANISTPSNRGRLMSLFQGSFLLGNSIGPSIGGVTAELFGYRAPFFVYAALALIVGLWMLLRLPDPRRIGGASQREGKERPAFLFTLRSLITKPGVMLAALIGLLAAYTRSGSRNMAVPLLGADIGASESQIGFTLTIIFFMTVIALYWVGTLADRFGAKAVLVPSWLFTALGLIVVATATSYWLFLVGATVYGLASGLGAPVPVAYLANIVDEESQGLALGFYRTLNDLGQVIGPLVMGAIGDLGSISGGVLTNAGLIIVVTILFFLFAPNALSRQVEAKASVSA